MTRRSVRAIAVPPLLAAAVLARAAHPLQTEDTGTQGAGNVEVENGLQRARADGASVATYQPQVSLGLATTVDAIVQPAWISMHDGGDGSARTTGFGDTNVDAKWRFWGVDPWSLAIRAGVTAPTGEHGLGLPHRAVSGHALLAATWDRAPTTAHFDVGVVHLPRGATAPGQRASVARVSAALMQALDERLILTADGSVSQDPSTARHGAVGTILGGVIWTVRPGLDLDAGYQASLDARPATRLWLAGLTVRFGL